MEQQSDREKKMTKTLLSLADAAKKQREKDVEDVWEDIASYVLPRVTEIRGGSEPRPTRYGEKMYNSEGLNALRLASNGTSGYMMPRTSQWVKMEPTDKSVLNIPGVRQFFEESTEALHAEMNRSNFYGEMTPVLDSGFSFGTSTLFIEDDTESGAVNLISVDPSEMYVAENKFKVVDTFFRRHWMTAQNILDKFGDACDERMTEQFRRQPFEMHEVLHAVYKREDRVFEKLDAANKPWASVYILIEKQKVLREGGFDFPRYVCWRHTRITGTPYGGSPAWDALADILRINSHSMDLLDASHLAVRPPMAYPQEMHDLDISPNGMNPFRLPGRVPQKLDVLGDFPYGIEREEAIRKAIRDHFQTDFFLLLTQNQREKTAYEVSEMAGERAAVMSTVIGRIESELIDPVLEIIYRLASLAGRMPAPPAALVEAQKDEFRWEYVGPLAQLQRRHHGQRTRSELLMQNQVVFELFPETRDIIDADELLRIALHEGGMASRVVRDNDAVAKMRQARAEMEAQQVQQESQMGMVEAMGGTKAPEPGSAAEGMVKRGQATPRDL